MVVTFASDNIQTSQTKFHKMCFNEIIMESLFIIAFQTIGLFNLMVHNHHSSIVDILQVLLMAGHLEINDNFFFIWSTIH
jgi:hypothetical protein